MHRILVTGTGSVMGLSIYDALISSQHTEKLPLILLNSADVSAPGLRSKNYRSMDKFIVAPEAKSSEYKSFITDLITSEDNSIVYPGTQHELEKLADLRDLGYPIACPSSKIVNLCSDKFSLAEYLFSKGVSHPRTWILPSFLESHFEDTRFIVKPRSGSASRGMQILSQSGVRIFASSIENPQSWIVQEYLEGDEYTCSVYRDKLNHSVKSLVMRRELSPDGASISGVVEHNDEIESYLADVVTALVEFGWDFGNINVQLRHSGSGTSLFEINPRLSSTESPKAKMGFDTVTAFFRNIVDIETSNLAVPTPGTAFLRYYSDIIYKV